MSKALNDIFFTSNECKDNACKLDRKGIKTIYKPDLGIKDVKLKKEVFGSVLNPQLCDCIIIKKDDNLTILEIKCGTVTNHLLKEIIVQITNVYKLLEKKGITVNRCMFICKKFSDALVKKRLIKERIKGIPLTHKVYTKNAIEI